MRRREFIRTVGGAAAAPLISPLLASAQQAGRLRHVCVLMGIAESDPAQQSLVLAFTQALENLGWQNGRNIQIVYRWGAGDADKIQTFAREFVDQKPDLIVAHTTPVVAALMQQSSAVPIVFTQVSDPIGSHFVDSLARPGGNLTGFTNLESSMGAKLTELLKEVVPGVQRVALMFNPATAPDGGAYFTAPVEAAAPMLKVKMVAAPVRSPAEIEAIIGSLASEPNTGLIVMPDIFILAHREQIVALVDRYRRRRLMPIAFSRPAAA